MHRSDVRFHFVGLGGGGCNVVEGIHAKGVQGRFTCITHPERPHLPKQIQFLKFPSLGELERRSPRGVPDMTRTFQLSDQIREVFSEGDTYILFAGLGGYTGTKIVEQLIPWLLKDHHEFAVYCSIPFAFEGERRTIAVRLADQFHSLPNFHYFDLESVREKYFDFTVTETGVEFWNLFKKTFPEGDGYREA